MPTTFAELHTAIRTIVGDTDEVVKQYPSWVLDQHITFAASALDSEAVVINGDGISFTESLSLKLKAIVEFRAAKGLVAGIAERFSYRSPVMSVSRAGTHSSLMRYIEGVLSDLEGDTCPIDFDTEYEVLLNGAAKHIEMMSDAQGVEL